LLLERTYVHPGPTKNTAEKNVSDLLPVIFLLVQDQALAASFNKDQVFRLGPTPYPVLTLTRQFSHLPRTQ
jgi:hypothetical protein